MTDKKRCKHFRVIGRKLTSLWVVCLFSFLWISCATASHPDSNHADGRTPGSAHQLEFKYNLSKEIRADIEDPVVETGSVTLLRVAVPEKFKSKPISALFEGVELPFYPATDVQSTGQVVYFETLLSIPYEKKPGSATATLRIGDEKDPQAMTFPLEFKVKEGNYLSEVLHVDASKVNPKGKKVLARITREQREVGKLYTTITFKKYWDRPFQLPIQNGIVTSAFGTKRLYNGQLKNFHTGLDLKAPMRTPIRAAANGKVVLAKDLFFSGHTVMIDHGYGVVTVYCHLSRFKVKVGQMVKAGDLIGLSGKTGRVNGPHLHWQTVVHKIKVNPLALMKAAK